MSNETPRHERVTLTDEEREALTCDCGVMEDDPTWPETFCPFHSGRMNLEISGSADALVSIVERILAAREQALREEIAGQIEADCEADEPPCYGCWNAARIARGEAQ